MGSRSSLPAPLRRLARYAREIMEETTGSPTLHKHCVESSFFLQGLAEGEGIRVDVVGGAALTGRSRFWWENLTTHAWCEHQGLIVDITATQFWRVSPVYVVPAGHRRYPIIKLRNHELWGSVSRPTDVRGAIDRARARAREEALRG